MTKQAPPTPMPPEIEPPEGWLVQTEQGVLRSDMTKDGRLARLDAVVNRLMHVDGWPCSEAVHTVCAALESPDSRLQVYVIGEVGFAKPLTPGVSFAGLYGETANRGTCGLVGAGAGMRNCWTTAPECSVYEALNLERLAVPLRQAFTAWGYGRVVAPAAEVLSLVSKPDAATFDTMAQYRKGFKDRKQLPPTWTDEEKDLVITEAKRRHKQPGARAAMAEMLGVTVERVNSLVRERKKETAPPKDFRRTA